MIIIGWILIVMGVLFIVLSLIGALIHLLKPIRQEKGLPNKALLDAFSNVISALTKLLAELLKAPQWFIVFVSGLILIYIGTRLQAGLSLF